MSTNGMMFCHICKAEAFVRMRLTSTVSLDCGHVEKIPGAVYGKAYGEKPPPTYEMRQPTPKPKRERKPKVEAAHPTPTPQSTFQSRVYQCGRHKVNYVTECPQCETEREEAFRKNNVQRRTTNNVTGTLSDLLSGKGSKSRTY